ISSESRQASIYSNQTEQLYNTLGYSTVGNITGALVLSIVMAPKSDPQVVWSWFIAILSVSFYRSIFAFIYNRRDTSDKSNINWRFQFKLGANMLAITWSSSMWLFYPVGYAEYQVVLILALFAIASGAIAIQSYDRSIITVFHGILFLGIESRLLWEGGYFSYELALFTLIFFVFIMKGAHDIGRSYNELLMLRYESEDRNQAKSEFLSKMSHELRTPLNAIIAFSDLILYEKNMKPALGKHIEHIHKAGSHLLALVDDVLDLARIESGNFTIVVKPVKLQKVMEECYSLIKPIAQDAGVSLLFNTHVDYIVQANHISLKQALLNLFSNAVKYNQQQGTITVSYEVKNNKRLRINIIDTGKGLNTKQQKQLFEPFERMGAEFSKVKGTGIGLTITRQLINIMGGSVGVESTVGKGSNFWIELLLSDEHEIAEPEPEPTLTKRIISKTQQSKYIVYVEDDPVNAHLMSEIINKLTNHHLVIAKTGKEGLKLILEQLPDLVLLDIGLPDIDGYEILEQMHSHPQAKKIPVIALTAKAMIDDVERGEKAGFDDYMVKPVRADELLKSIEQIKKPFRAKSRSTSSYSKLP
ncbi:MAG: response regulator, partial [Gammaproteobacteria bacterium]|nr:response regulator [Gammaproteobacteria bacterium]